MEVTDILLSGQRSGASLGTLGSANTPEGFVSDRVGSPRLDSKILIGFQVKGSVCLAEAIFL